MEPDADPGSSRESMWRIVHEADADVVALNRAANGAEIDRAVEVLAAAYAEFRRLEGTIAANEETATVHMWLHSTLNCCLMSVAHLVQGYPIASGVAMRVSLESVAMAMLCCDPRTGVLKAYLQNRAIHDVGSALHLVTRKQNATFLMESIGFDREAWDTVLAMLKLYDKFAHASLAALAFQMRFTGEGGLFLGPAFDEDKYREHRSDFIRRRTAAESLAHIVPIIFGALPKKSG